MQYDVHRISGSGAVDLAVVLQDDALSGLSTRIVAPLIATENTLQMDRGTPSVEIGGSTYRIAVHLLATVPQRALGPRVGSVAGHERAIKNALDLVFFGV